VYSVPHFGGWKASENQILKKNLEERACSLALAGTQQKLLWCDSLTFIQVLIEADVSPQARRIRRRMRKPVIQAEMADPIR
jgi:hypothetical protein